MSYSYMKFENRAHKYTHTHTHTCERHLKITFLDVLDSKLISRNFFSRKMASLVKKQKIKKYLSRHCVSNFKRVCLKI